MKKIIFTLLAFLFSISAMAAVNINTATQAELESLNGIGPVKAKAIVDYRKAHGSFKSVDELQNVDGIGDVTLKNLRKDVSITGKTTAVAAQGNKPAKDAKHPKNDVKAVGNEKAAASGKTTDSKEVKETKEHKTKKIDKPAKDSQAAGAEKTASSAKTTDAKEVKEEKTEKQAKDKPANETKSTSKTVKKEKTDKAISNK